MHNLGIKMSEKVEISLECEQKYRVQRRDRSPLRGKQVLSERFLSNNNLVRMVRHCLGQK